MQEQGLIREALRTLAPGGRTEGVIAVGTMASGSPFGIPFIVLKGKRPGKTLWINGQVHGSEVTGMVSALDFVNSLDRQTMSGNLVVTVTGNPLGLDARQKNAPQDGNDLDQSFPGRKDGFVSERIAWLLFEEIRGVPDLLINMHAQSTQVMSRSYTVYKEHPNGKVSAKSLFPYMAAFNPHLACRMNLEGGQGELPGNIGGALDYQLLAIGIPAFMVELGVAQRAELDDVAQGTAGFDGVARCLGIIEGQPAKLDTLRRVTRRGHATVTHGGLFRPSRRPGDLVRAGEPFGEIMDMFGKVVERPSLSRDAIIIAIRVDPVMHSGDRFGYMAYEWDDVKLGDLKATVSIAARSRLARDARRYRITGA